LSDLVPIERSIQSNDGAQMTVRIRPYRTAEDKIDGVVVTFMK
jgi:two-component system CheB/CheR fusion protein